MMPCYLEPSFFINNMRRYILTCICNYSGHFSQTINILTQSSVMFPPIRVRQSSEYHHIFCIIQSSMFRKYISLCSRLTISSAPLNVIAGLSLIRIYCRTRFFNIPGRTMAHIATTRALRLVPEYMEPVNCNNVYILSRMCQNNKQLYVLIKFWIYKQFVHAYNYICLAGD